MNPTVEVQNLNVSYHGVKAVENIDFSFSNGSLIGILGPNGAGKSTMMKAMLGLIQKDSGTIQVNGKPISEMRKNIAYVSQRSNIDMDFPIVVKDTVLLGTYPKLGLFRSPKKADKEWAMECLEKVEMEDFANEQIGELSGGQQQRIFLARALAQRADFFFLDEPFVGIDVSSEEVIIKILKDLKAEGKMVFVVHHDLSKVESYFDTLILMNKYMVGCGSVHDVFQDNKMKQAYQRDFSIERDLGVGI